MSEQVDFYGKIAKDIGCSRQEAKRFWIAAMHSGGASHPLVTQTQFQKVAQFHRKYRLEYEGKPRELDDELALFRIGFMLEELAEYCVASGYKKLGNDLSDLHGMLKNRETPHSFRGSGRNFHDQLDALVDLSYVVNGTAYLQGFDFDAAFQTVHEANMKKIRTERPEDSKRGSKYDVVKPHNWSPPDLTEFL